MIIPQLFEFSADRLHRADSQSHLNDFLHEAINGFELDNLSPFHLVLFHNSYKPIQISWNGLELMTTEALQPVTSSSFEFEEVSNQRIAQFNASVKTFDYHQEYHASHSPEASAYSVCMHRSDAQTVSFTHIDTSTKTLNYWPKSPCTLVTGSMHQTTF